MEIVVDSLSQAIEPAVKDMGASVEREPHRVVLTVDAIHKRALIEMVWASGGDVLSLTPMKSSLEEMFLKVVGQEVASDSNHRV